MGREIISWFKKNAFCFREFKCYEQNKAELTARDARGTGLLLYRGSWGEGGRVKQRTQVRASQAAGRQLGVPSWEWAWRHEGISSMGRWAAKVIECKRKSTPSRALICWRANEGSKRYLWMLKSYAPTYAHGLTSIPTSWPFLPLWPGLESRAWLSVLMGGGWSGEQLGPAPGLLDSDSIHLDPSKADLAQLPREAK